MTKKQKKMLYRILIAAVLFLAAKFAPLPMIVSTILYFAAYLTIGYDILRKAWKGICNHQVFDENFLMAVATIGAIALAIYEKSGEYDEAVAVMLFYHRRAVPKLRRRQVPPQHHGAHGHPPRLREH